MRFSKATRITFILACLLLVLGLAGFSVISGEKIDAAGILGTIFAGVAGLLAGTEIARKNR